MIRNIEVDLPKGFVSFNNNMYAHDTYILSSIIPNVKFTIIGSVEIKILEATKTLYMAFVGDINDIENQNMIHMLEDVLKMNEQELKFLDNNHNKNMESNDDD